MATLGQQLRDAGERKLAAGDYAEAAQLLAQALGCEESAEGWNDWAGAQWRLGRGIEAIEGFRCALELDPSFETAMINLAASLAESGRWDEARPWLELARARAGAAAAKRLDELLAEAQRQAPVNWNADAAEAYVRRFSGRDPNTLDYFNTHLRRYVATLEMVPPAKPGQRLLELGAAFHHLTPALQRLKGYAEIRCSDIWDGAGTAEHSVASNGGEERLTFTVDNFDVEHAPWPYADASFDMALCCEILEHLVRDPMSMMVEINRVLRPGGMLLLTTPNLASAKAVEFLGNGETPYCWSQYEPEGLPTDRHNREYTTAEVVRLLAAAGFETAQLRTKNFYWPRPTAIRARLAAHGCSIAYRGDTTLVLARKAGPVQDRYPDEFYMTGGSQGIRRAAERNGAGARG